MRAIVVEGSNVTLVDELDESVLGEPAVDNPVAVDVTHSSINFKDALALTGRPGIIRAPKLIAGIDLVGTTAAGDRVLVNGCGLGETHNGGLATRALVDAEWLVPVPDSMSLEQVAAVGTAGYTAMLAVRGLERAGVSPDSSGSVLVTGAAGGVGSIAVALLARLGYRVAASTGREEAHDYLRSLGATTIVDRAEFVEPGKALQSQRWSGVVESVGGATLSNVLAQVHYGGTVAAIGNASSAEFTSSVYPFILRAVSLVGINSVYTPRDERLEAWRRLGTDLDLGLLDSMTTVVALDEAIPAAARVLGGEVRGRTVVDVRA